MTEDDVRRIVADMLGVDVDAHDIAAQQFYGSVSKKMLGDAVAEAGLRSRFVLVDLSKVRSIGGKKVWWR